VVFLHNGELVAAGEINDYEALLSERWKYMASTRWAILH